jgi:mannose-6-phosphate isomerase-like protein (cupin superfamily)
VSEKVIVRHRDEGRTVLVGGADYITYKVRSAETDRAFFCFEASSSPGFGPPLHSHSYRELFYVLEGEYEFTIDRDGELGSVQGGPGTAVSVDADVPHTFRNSGSSQGRLLFVHMPAALEEFFEEYGVPVSRHGEVPEGLEPPDFGAMAAALERNGVKVLASPEAVR